MTICVSCDNTYSDKILLILKNYCMGKLKCWFNRPIKRSSMSLIMIVVLSLTFIFFTFRVKEYLKINEMYCGVISRSHYVLINDDGEQKELLYKVYGYANSEAQVCEGDSVTIVSFYGGLDNNFRSYLGQPNEDLVTLMMQNALTEVYRLFLFVGGFYILILLIMYFVDLSRERNYQK